MVVIDNTVVADEIVKEFFLCDIIKCKGACCVEGDAGAPLEPDEVTLLQKIIEDIKPFMDAEGLKTLEAQGFYTSESGELATTLVNGRECTFAYRENNILKCSIEKAFTERKTSFRKPISCHLYPIRISSYKEYEFLNYSEWEICSPACDNGKILQIPLYIFLKPALVRKYGEEWYQKLEAIIQKTKS
ncbi:MAG: DUF3109 family protein [Chitinophagaceae bacterium]|nr:DUF3109 family protein [Chitinophagaceae bacterium]